MKIGIGLPAAIPGVKGDIILEWARRADAGPFSSLGLIDRLVYPNYEPLITLAAASAVTQRVRLMSSILLAPLRNPVVLAKQAASIDALSGGRLTLGLGIGGREDDYKAVHAPFKGRGKRFEEQLALMKRVWSGQPLSDDVGPVGPSPARPGGPEVLIGGYSAAALKRVGRWADGYISGGGSPSTALRLYQIAEEAWRDEGRPGKPRFVGAAYYALGPDAMDRGGWFLRDYYNFLGPGAERIAQAMLSSSEAVREAIKAFSDIGADELVFWPSIPDLDQVELLAELVS